MSAKRVKLKSIRIELDRELIKAAVAKGGKKATWSALDYLASVSKQQVPLDTGALMNSCVVDVNDDGSEGTVSYDTPYAVEQHENMQYHHQRDRKAKYLEDPVNDGGVQQKMITLAQSSFESVM
ncbi:MAG: hypothetical protein IKH75_01140 [Ruminococcus sp.]|nr:hypothetical protein [Ruminococcus sp.]